MRHYECECLRCGRKTQIRFEEEPYPELDDVFMSQCKVCGCETEHKRVITRKAAAEANRKQQEADLRRSIEDQCNALGFSCRFIYQSVIITTPLADWCFDYHVSRVTLYHESTVKINFATGDYAKAHIQFQDRKMSPAQVIDYIDAHDRWRAAQRNAVGDTKN